MQEDLTRHAWHASVYTAVALSSSHTNAYETSYNRQFDHVRLKCIPLILARCSKTFPLRHTVLEASVSVTVYTMSSSIWNLLQ